MDRGERTLLDFVDAEVRFWATVIAHNTAIRLGESEALWVGRVVRLANIIRNSADRRREGMAFPRDQFSRGTLTVPGASPRIVAMAPEGWLSGSCHASRIPALRGAHGLHAFFRQEESPCSTLSR